jgi:hypothetical protein
MVDIRLFCREFWWCYGNARVGKAMELGSDGQLSFRLLT